MGRFGDSAAWIDRLRPTVQPVDGVLDHAIQ